MGIYLLGVFLVIYLMFKAVYTFFGIFGILGLGIAIIIVNLLDSE